MLKTTRQLKSFKILVIGDACQDYYYFGNIENFCFEERPLKKEGTPVLKVNEVIEKPGMSLNVLENLIKLNQRVDLGGNRTIKKKIRIVKKKQDSIDHIVRVDIDDNVSAMDSETLKNIDLKKYDCIMISDYDKGYVDNKLISHIVNNFKGEIFVDSKKTDLSSFENCIIKINEHEDNLVTKYPDDFELIVTLGKRGASWNNKIFPAAECKEVKDICGAGDTFFASFAIAYMHTKDYSKSINIANECTTQVLKTVGNHHPDINKIKSLICN